MITRNARTGKFSCGGKFNPNTKKWSKQSNSPHDCDASMWPMDWPQVGGGGSGELEQEELFQRMCAWDDVNFIVGAATNGASDKHRTEGMVDNHAYSVIECHNDVAGTDIDLIKVRNPWGRGEIEDGMFDDDGPGWDRYPQIKRQLKPVSKMSEYTCNTIQRLLTIYIVGTLAFFLFRWLRMTESFGLPSKSSFVSLVRFSSARAI